MENKIDLGKIKITKILSNSISKKKIVLLGTIDNISYLIIVEKSNFEVNSINNYIGNIELSNFLMSNDIYSKYNFINNDKNSIVIIKNPDQKTIKKYSESKNKIYMETYEDYKNNFLVEMNNNFDTNTQWIINIFDGKSEQDKILFQDNDFILLPDYKWNQESIDDLYYLGIMKPINSEFIKSVRDLNNTHLSILKKMNNIVTLIEKKHELEKNKIIAYVHYHPSFYIFHVHYVYLNNDVFQSSFPRSILLTDIIDNIKLDSNYYQKKTFLLTI